MVPALRERTRRSASRTLRFVNAIADVPRSGSDDIVVLDTSWTPDPSRPDEPTPVRPALTAVLDAENLFLTSLSLLDKWADARGLPEAFARDGVSWWFHARSFVRLDLQELLLWSRLLDILAPDGAFASFLVPDDRPLLAEAIRARRTRDPGPKVRITTGSAAVSSDRSGKPPAPRSPRRRRVIAPRRLARRLARTTLVVLRLRPKPIDREAILFGRLERLARQPGPLLAVVQAQSFHHVEVDGALVRRDPYVGPVIARLAARGRATVTLGLKIRHRRTPDWSLLEDDELLLPSSLLQLLPGASGGAEFERIEAAIAAQLAAVPEVPICDRGVDLGPAVTRIVADLGPWLASQMREMDQAGRLMDTLKPGMLLTGWEAARTAWLGAARHHGIPSIAIQHGVIYPDTPDYCRPENPALVKPDLTCVYGPYERAILTGQGRYAESAVVATGSPRVDPQGLQRLPEAERAAVRADLGVADGDRVLVISGGRMTIGDRMGTVPLLARVLDGPLPGVHLIVKLHPEEKVGEHYRHLVAGLARAGGYAVPPVTIIRDIDLYRLLRAADAHIGVFSTVLTDSVLAGVPNMIVVGQAWADLLGYVDAGVATPVRSVADVRAFMADPKSPSEDARRRFIDAHYMAGDAVGRIADLIAPVIAGSPDGA
jgi:hypothetical protein